MILNILLLVKYHGCLNLPDTREVYLLKSCDTRESSSVISSLNLSLEIPENSVQNKFCLQKGYISE